MVTQSTAPGTNPTPYFDVHVFICTNQRRAGHPRGCCMDKKSIELRNYMKSRVKERGLNNVRINAAGCLDRCELGPTMVVYPQGVWYTFASKEDIDEIISVQIERGEILSRLLLSPNSESA